ncbi:MAG: phosphoribosyl-AMP cyclohydrolase [Candidatus Nanopelagicaceae bacterium]|nr:phosphoribosyl-AMP cyclohydrolase [Candidatus Nanopelagicaceae bacterium]
MNPTSINLDEIFKSADDLVAAVLQDHLTNEVLMLAWMNREALELTLKTGKATFWSRSRGAIWIKGETSGNYQEVISLALDCDQDALLIKVKSHGPACHTGEVSCFNSNLGAN